MAYVDTDAMISVTDAGKVGIPRLVKDAEEGKERIVLRNNRAVAAIVGMSRLEDLERLQEDLADISLVAARLITDKGSRSSLDDVLTRFGYTREELSNL